MLESGESDPVEGDGVSRPGGGASVICLTDWGLVVTSPPFDNPAPSHPLLSHAEVWRQGRMAWNRKERWPLWSSKFISKLLGATIEIKT